MGKNNNDARKSCTKIELPYANLMCQIIDLSLFFCVRIRNIWLKSIKSFKFMEPYVKKYTKGSFMLKYRDTKSKAQVNLMQESGENYLETILILKQRNGTVRSIDVARELSVSKPSVSRAIGILRDGGFITMEQNGELNLTEQGRARAGAIYERHRYITKFLAEVVGVTPTVAEADACRIEHIISQETFLKIKKYLADHSITVE